MKVEKRVFLFQPSHDTIDIQFDPGSKVFTIISAGQGRVLMRINRDDLRNFIYNLNSIVVETEEQSGKTE